MHFLRSIFRNEQFSCRYRISGCRMAVHCIQLNGMLQSFASTNFSVYYHVLDRRPATAKASTCKDKASVFWKAVTRVEPINCSFSPPLDTCVGSLLQALYNVLSKVQAAARPTTSWESPVNALHCFWLAQKAINSHRHLVLMIILYNI
jgi:hypothetical protein